MKKLFVSLLTLGLLALAAPVHAGQSAPTITLSPGPYVQGGSVTASVDPYTQQGPWWSINCTASDGSTLLTTGNSFGPAGTSITYQLSSPVWTSGPGDCVIGVWHNKWHGSTPVFIEDATVSFHVDG